MRLSIIVVGWNVKTDLLGCLGSIEANRPHAEYEIIVVDNASTDSSVIDVQRQFPNVTVIANGINRGFAAANNQGFEDSRGDYVLFLNPDTIVESGSLDTLIGFMDDNEDVGVCGPKLLNDDGTIQPSVRQFPTFRGTLHCHTVFRLSRVFQRQYKKWLMKDFRHDRQMDVDQVMGAALMARRSVIEQVGKMDERYFMYYEEVDLCYRIKGAGWRVVFVPEAVITHLGGKSAEQIPLERRIMMLRSLLSFFRKHRGRVAARSFSVVFKVAIILRDFFNLLIGFVTYAAAILVHDDRRKQNSAVKISRSAAWLGKYACHILFRM
jgi:GT2 family glycosyltransferase